MITLLHTKQKADKYLFYFYLTIQGRGDELSVIKIQGTKAEATHEIKYLILTDLIGNFSTFICGIHKDIDSIELLSDKEVTINLFDVLQKMVHMKETVDSKHKIEREYMQVAKGILKYRKELFSIVHVLGKDYKRYAQYVALMKSCSDVVSNDISTFFETPQNINA
jgi:hypothetical protein